MINTTHAMMIAATVGAATTVASASIAIQDDFGIFSPCNDAQVEVIWIGSDAGYTGELSWINPDPSATNPVLWTNKSAIQGQSYILPGTFGKGERVDFMYEVTQGGLDVFSTANENDWDQFFADDSNPHDVIVGIEDIRLPGGDSDHNDAMFRVVFNCGTTFVPTPGSFALLGAGGLLVGRRRR